MKAFVMKVTETGQVVFIWDDIFRGLVDEGAVSVSRASNVEPNSKGFWEADLGPVGGPVLGPFRLREEALKAEVEWIVTNVITEAK